jgi:NAD(P)-dependent dehydrogenase (short-subunit alcohol dehydrogenase family)
MRRQGWGRIVNLSSMGGRLTFPGGGWYHASKYALESISDALRFETRSFGVRVVVIEPGFIRTSFGDTAGTTGSESTAHDSPYAPLMAAVDASLHDAYEGNLARLGGGPEKVAAVIERAITARNPKPRYQVTPSARVLIGARRWSTDRMWDASMRRTFKAPKVAATPDV